MILVSPSGKIVGHNIDYGFIYFPEGNYDSNSHLRLQIQDVILSETGEYQLVVNPHTHFNPIPNHLGGDFDLTYQVGSIQPIGNVVPGEAISHELILGATDFWILEGEVGEIVSVHVVAEEEIVENQNIPQSQREFVNQGYLDTELRLFTPSMLLIAESTGVEPTLETRIDAVRLPESGQYILTVNSGINRITTGRYRLIVNSVVNNNQSSNEDNDE